MGSILLIGSASYSRYKELNFIFLPLDILQNNDKLYEFIDWNILNDMRIGRYI